MLQLGRAVAGLDIGHGVRAAVAADQQAVALGEVAHPGRLGMHRDQAPIGRVRLARRDRLGDDPALRILAQMDHLGAGVGLLMSVGDGDRIEFARAFLAAQDAGRIFPRHGRAGFNLGPGHLRPVAAAVGALGDEIVDAALALGIAGVPVLDRRIFDLGVVQCDQFDHRRMQLVLVAHRGRAALQIGAVAALVGDDQGPFELAGVRRIDAEIGRQLHWAFHARRDVDERAVAEDRAVQGREIVVRDRHHRPQIFAHQLRVFAQGLGNRHENHAHFRQLGLEGGDHADAVKHRIHGVARRALDACQHFLLLQRDAQLGVDGENLRIDLVQ